MNPTHPSVEYLIVAAVAAAGCFLTTPIARAVAVRVGAIARPRDRDVHAVAIPRMGGVALFAGLGLALFVASRLPTLQAAFREGPEIIWVLVSAGLICLIGALDDRYELDSLTKLAGQVLATGIMVTLGGVQLTLVYVPWGDNGTVVLGQDLAIPLTILLTVLTINALNFIDGLDGLAAGVTAIGAAAFFVFAYHLGQTGQLQIAATPTVLTAALAGACLGFLPHNFFPARIFMGDSGSMLVGLLLAAAATSATTSADPQAFAGAKGSLPLVLPLLVSLAVLAIPFVDLLLAVVRRVSHGRSPFAPDKQHLHHRLLELGHSHRRAVLLMYFWAALLAFGVAAFSIVSGTVLVAMLLVGAVIGVALLVVPGWRDRRRAARRAATPAPGSSDTRPATTASGPATAPPTSPATPAAATPAAATPAATTTAGTTPATTPTRLP